MTISRRRFLAATGVAVVATACSGDGDGTRTVADAELETAARGAGLEKLVADTYAAIGTQITQGRLGTAVPAALSELTNAAVRQHLAHLDAWNTVLAGAGRPAVTDPDPRLRPLVDAAMAKLTDIPAAATLTLRLEDYLSRTYLQAIPTLERAETITLAARMLVVDQQRQAVLRYVLGLHPVGSGADKGTRDFAPADPRAALITG